MNFARKIAKRFMLGGKGAGPSRLTGWIAITGLAVGCMAMVLSISVLNGFESRVVKKIMGFEGDIRVSNLSNWDKAVADIKSMDDVQIAIEFQQRKGLILGRGDSQRMVLLKAVDPDLITEFYNLNLVKGDQSKLPMVYLGEMTAKRLNLKLGDGFRIVSPIDQGSAWGMPIQVQCVVGGIFSIQVLDLDDKIAFIPRNVGKKLFIRKNSPDGLDIRLKNQVDVDVIAALIQSQYPLAKVKTWKELHHELFGAMKFERIGALAVLSLIIVVACFNLVTTLLLVMAQKIREFGILQIIGTPPKIIQSIIMNQGFMIGGIGVFTGLTIGLGLIIFQNVFGIISLPEDIYFTPYLPMDIFAFDLIVILCISVGMVSFSTFIAAKRALMISPLEAVYSEK